MALINRERERDKKYRIGEVKRTPENISAAAGDNGDFHSLKTGKTRKTLKGSLNRALM